MFALIGTWEMSRKGVTLGRETLMQGGFAGDAVEEAVRCVEANPDYVSVGYGGLPAADGQVYLDAAYMDGDTLQCGAILSVTEVSSPIAAARKLCGRKTNWMLCGEGAKQFAVSSGVPLKDMRTPASQKRWQEAMEQKKADDVPAPYKGHDTVCILGLDENGHMVCGTSTSGLFLKVPGRIGDSPIPGCGFYCDARYGAAAATGLGEDIMRGCLSYEIVARMRAGHSPQAAAEGALSEFVKKMQDLKEDHLSISLIALSPDGRYGAATTEAQFPFTAALPDGVHVFSCTPKGEHMDITSASPEEMSRLN